MDANIAAVNDIGLKAKRHVSTGKIVKRLPLKRTCQKCATTVGVATSKRRTVALVKIRLCIGLKPVDAAIQCKMLIMIEKIIVQEIRI